MLTNNVFFLFLYAFKSLQKLIPECPKPFFEVQAGHYSYSFDAKVLKLLVVTGHFIMYMEI